VCCLLLPLLDFAPFAFVISIDVKYLDLDTIVFFLMRLWNNKNIGAMLYYVVILWVSMYAFVQP
jgi:hypothetical protein